MAPEKDACSCSRLPPSPATSADCRQGFLLPGPATTAAVCHRPSARESGKAHYWRPCVFPFIYKNRIFYTCTTEDTQSGKFWCSATGDYDNDGEWSYCADTRQHANKRGPCIFPFTYEGNSYTSCTTKGDTTGKLWCSLSQNYKSNWTYCDPSELRPCHFSFIFKGKSYSSCTKEGAPDGQLWCATTANYDKDKKWKACSLQEYEGNSRGQACVFPFIYKNRTFYTCTNESDENGRFWCATTGNHDKDKKWSYCADTRLDKAPKGPCVFPFIYNRRSYSSCATDGSQNGTLWCSLTRNHDVIPKRANCNPSEPFPCSFPFTFEGKSYNACTTEGSADEKLWCSTTDNYDEDGKWRVCSVQGLTLYTCINEDKDNERFWCATTENFDRDKKWSYCADTRLAANAHRLCMFPFVYNGKFYSSCTSHGTSSGKLWCSLTSNYDEDFKWDYCDSSVPRPCVFPFIYNGKSYSKCTKDGSERGKLWCSTTANHDKNPQWKHCALSEYGGNSGGRACVFPYVYKGRTYYTCTNEDAETGNFWCATTGSHDRDAKWSYCADTIVSVDGRLAQLCP
ncbi:fibronectin-like [Eublepharis macularius]|uniref:Fibronectin-like n=1 Tax=Eublepharis macularius TaxID=481883 RepID=A0AA97K1K3_EUBMA|nr:fibronectin-like [Eublepharis macularius]